MIHGHATQEATKAHMQKHSVACSRLGMTQLTVSHAGFGCYRARIEDAFEAVDSIYAEQAAHKIDRIRRTVAALDQDWAAAGTLSQKALRALRSTPGISCVLVGMRRGEYVSDVLAELQRVVKQESRLESWQKLAEDTANVL